MVPRFFRTVGIRGFTLSRNRPAPPPGHPRQYPGMNGRAGARAGTDPVTMEFALGSARSRNCAYGPAANAGNGSAGGAIAGNAVMGAAIGAGVGLIGGYLYDQHEKGNID